MILIDPPVWPAYETTWSHLVSDTSLEELHEFARRLGLPARGFDHDHYDVPADRYDEVVAAGAQPVPARDVLGALRGAGLRVAARDKQRVGGEHRLADLGRRWGRLPREYGWPAPTHGWRSAGQELLAKWSEPHRHYHDPGHLSDVVLAMEMLALQGYDGGPTAALAGWFHDAVYRGEPGEDEAASATLAVSRLGGLAVPDPVVERVGELIRGTARPGEADGLDAAVLNDADLAVLAGSPQRYNRYASAVRREYPHVSDEAFRTRRAMVLERLLQLPVLYHTPPANRRWERRARENLTRELDRLGSGQ